MKSGGPWNLRGLRPEARELSGGAAPKINGFLAEILRRAGFRADCGDIDKVVAHERY